jgi:membrane-associated protease RseP (regulator of RpoE activity)
MAINLPGKEKIATILQKISTSVGGASTADGGASQEGLSWVVKLRNSHLLKLIAASSVFLIFSLMLLLSVSLKMVSSVGQYKEISFVAPSLGEYLPSMSVEDKKAISASEDVVENNKKEIEPAERALPQIDTEIAINKSFDFLSKFENNKSRKTLLAIKPVIAGIQKDSLAEVAGLQTSDILLKVNGDPIESVMGFYILTSEKPSNEVTLEIDRKGKTSIVKLIASGSQSINSKNTGIVFNIPNGVTYVTQDEAKKLAQQYKEDFLSTISEDWQSQYANNLLRMTQQISLDSQLLLTASTPAKFPISKLKTNEFLQWHHQKYTSNLNGYYTKRSQIEGRVIEQLGSLGDALTGLSAALLAFLCGVLYYFFTRRA